MLDLQAKDIVTGNSSTDVRVIKIPTQK